MDVYRAYIGCTCFDTSASYRKGCPVHDPEVRAALSECANCTDLRRQLENAKLSEQYAMQTVANLHKEVAELAAERDNWKEQVENPKMTYCAFCGKQYDIDDREKALEEIANHVTECEKHPYAALNAKLADLNRRLEEAQSYNKD